MLTCCRALQLAVERLVDDAIATVFAAYLGLFAVPIALVQLFGEELEELMRILLLGCDKVLECFLLAEPKSRQNIGCRIPVGVLNGIEVLEHIVHGAAQTV